MQYFLQKYGKIFGLYNFYTYFCRKNLIFIHFKVKKLFFMEREALKSKVTEKLGSTQLTAITDETINHQLDFALGFVSDDAQVDDAFVEKVVANLKNIDGGSHKLIGSKIQEYKAQHPQPVTSPVPSPSPAPSQGGEDDGLALLRKDIEARFKKMEEEAASVRLKAEKDEARKQIARGFRSLFKSSGLEVNDFLLEVAMKDIVIPDKDIDVSSLVKETEAKYVECAKKLNLDTDVSRRGGGGGGGKSKTDLRFEAKKRRQAAGQQ